MVSIFVSVFLMLITTLLLLLTCHGDHLFGPFALHYAKCSAIVMLTALTRQSTEIQKVLAFDGIFEKLFSVVTREGGLEGPSVVTDALRCVDTLLRFNTSNQVKSL